MSAPSIHRACHTLRLREFRNFRETELEFPPAGVALIGDNGAGKTNLIEALYYLEIFRSFRGAPDDQLVRFGADVFHLRGRFRDSDGGDEHEVTAAFERRTRRKRVTLDGTEPDRIGDALGKVGAVVFSPADIVLVAGPPGERRRFLDILLSLNAPGYLAALQRYRQILRQRNLMLRDRAAPSLVEPWDEGLVEWGSQVTARRAAWTAASAAIFADRFTEISGGPRAALRYRSSVPVPAADQRDPELEAIAESFRAELARLTERERERGMTLAGPHRDELECIGETASGEVDLREFGSGGQQRTAAIALRMVEAEMIRTARGRDPLVLLDDLFAELDPGRSLRILERLEADQRGQVILTAPKPSDLEPRRGSLTRWTIVNGEIRT
jgi:DNA replication and repair protein RecF